MVNNFKIHFEKSRPIYNAGELVSGVIEYFGDSEEIVKGLKVKCSGKALVSFQLGKSRIYDREILIKQSYFIFGNDQKEVRIPRGAHNYPFQFTLPLNLPSSFNGSNGSITYKIKAIMSKGSLSRDICAKTIFRVIDRNEIYSEPLMLTQKILRKERNHSCLFFDIGPIGFNLNIPSGLYTPGEIIPASLELTNKSQRSINGIELKLKQIITYTVHGTKRNQKITLSRAKRGGVEGGSDPLTWEIRLPVPETAPPSSDQCRIIQIQYMLLVRVNVSGFGASLKGKMPIRIGCNPEVKYQD